MLLGAALKILFRQYGSKSKRLTPSNFCPLNPDNRTLCGMGGMAATCQSRALVSPYARVDSRDARCRRPPSDGHGFAGLFSITAKNISRGFAPAHNKLCHVGRSTCRLFGDTRSKGRTGPDQGRQRRKTLVCRPALMRPRQPLTNRTPDLAASIHATGGRCDRERSLRRPARVADLGFQDAAGDLLRRAGRMSRC